MVDSALLTLLDQIKDSPEFDGNIPYWTLSQASEGDYSPFPDTIFPELKSTLQNQGIKNLYSHQADALTIISRGANIVISTGTASGKSLCYQIPILDSQLKTNAAKALLLFPTKALANDQLNSLNAICNDLALALPLPQHMPLPSVYDGDTPSYLRASIRENASIL